jgi:uncharacterized phage protein (TIGR02218 family)
MKTHTTELKALIESGRFFRADLYTLTLIDGTIVRTTDADIDLKWGGNTFTTCKPLFKREKISVSLGFEVDELSVTVIPNDTDTLVGTSWGVAIRNGALDGAELLVEKAYLSVWPVIVGVLHGFEGGVSDIDACGAEYRMAVKSAMELLNIDMPRNLYQSTCLHTLYDSGCTLSRATFTLSSTVTGGGSYNGFTASGLGQPAGYFDQGVIGFTSGANNGIRRTVKSHGAGGVLMFSLPLLSTPQAGDTFTIYPGCRRTEQVCIDTFNNRAHFKGYPFIPAPETAH